MKPCKCEEQSLKKLIEQIEDKRLPFTEDKITENIKLRKFDPSYPEHLYRWHWDEEDRFIEALNENDWEFQFDNELPIKLNKKIFIEKGRIHRLIKGSVELIIRIES